MERAIASADSARTKAQSKGNYGGKSDYQHDMTEENFRKRFPTKAREHFKLPQHTTPLAPPMASYLGSASSLLSRLEPDEDEIDDVAPPGVDPSIYDLLFLNNDAMEDEEYEEDDGQRYAVNSVKQGSVNWLRGLPWNFSKHECSICLDTFEGVGRLELECGHTFCEDCVIEFLKFELNQSWTRVKHTISALEKSGNAFRLRVATVFGVRCPHRGCLHIITSDDIQRLLEKDLFEKFQRFALKHVLEEMKGDFLPCPRNCGGFLQDNCTCVNEQCRLIAAREKAVRERQRYREWRVLNAKAHNSFGAWAKESQVRCCPLCYSAIFKDGGCNHMFCTVCKKPFNWPEAGRFGSDKHWYRPDGEASAKLKRAIASSPT